MELAKEAGPHARLIVSGHSNHPSFERQEAIEVARTLKGMGASIDISTFDLFVNRYTGGSPDNFYALLEADLVDTVSTDYGGGHHDSILTGLQFAVGKGVVDLPKAVSLATHNVAKAIPVLAPNRGLLEEGKVADVVITDEADLAQVETVIIGGQVVVENGVIAG